MPVYWTISVQAHVGSIYKDYNQEQITKIQVSKQADVMVLFLLLEELFLHQVKLAVTVMPGIVEIINQTESAPVASEVWGEEYTFEKELVVPNKAN